MNAEILLASFLCAAMEQQRRRRFRTAEERNLHSDLLGFVTGACRACGGNGLVYDSTRGVLEQWPCTRCNP